VSAEHAFEPQTVPLEHLLRRLAASLDGLGRQEAHERLEHEGRNVLPEHVRSSRLVRLARHSTHRFALLLWAGAALALVGEAFGKGHGMGLIAAALGAVVVINALFGFWQEELALTALVLESGAGHAIFGTASPPLAALLVPIPFAVAMLAVSEVIKALRRGAHTRASVPRGRAGAQS
jgi:hypothetical protein